MDAFWAAPPVTRTYVALMVVESLLESMKIISGHNLIYHHMFLFKFGPEVWRLVTSFCLTSGLSIIFLPYAIWNYGIPLERNSSRFNSASFLVYLLFVGSCIILLSGELLGGYLFTNAMVLAITYTYAQENRGGQVQFFIMPVPVQYLPLVMLFFTLVNAGPEMALIESMAIPAAHLYDFLTMYWPRYGGGRNLLPTPAILERMFADNTGGTRVETKGHATTFQPASATNSSSGSSSAVSNPLAFRGTGRRLGG